MIEYIKRHIEWSRSTFGTGTFHKGLCKHIRKESLEIEENPGDLMEWIDVIILAIDGAWRQGYTAEEIMQVLEDKQQINIARRWPIDPDRNEPTEHLP